jgi:Flp pilus assembly protein TadG
MSIARFRQGLIRCQRSTVAIYIALLAPVLAGAVALGVEVTSWSGAQLDMQRIADASARAAAISCYNYSSTNNGSSCLSNNTAAQTAATLAARLAEANHATGSSTPTWNAATTKYSDNQITAQIIQGLKSSSNAAVQVSVQETIPLTISRAFTSTPAVTVSATSTGEVVGTTAGGSGGQPCLLALQKGSASTSGITANGSITVTAPSCTLVSNSSFNDSGGSSFSVAGIYAVGQIAYNGYPALTLPCWATINGTSSNNGCNPWPSSGLLQSNTYVHGAASAITDPYASNTAMQAAMTNAGSTTGSSITCYNQWCYYGPQGTGPTTQFPSTSGRAVNGSYCSGQGTGSVTCYLQPGNYGSFSVTSGGPYYFNYAAGGYVFNGTMSLTNNTTHNGTGVTIFTTGTFTGSNTFNYNLIAPSTTVMPSPSTGGPWQIAGVVLAGSTTGTVSLSGNPQFLVTGVVYFPNATFNSQGSNGLGASGMSCLEIIVDNITLSGATYLNSSCSGLNALSFYSQPGNTIYTTALTK